MKSVSFICIKKKEKRGKIVDMVDILLLAARKAARVTFSNNAAHQKLTQGVIIGLRTSFLATWWSGGGAAG